MNHAALVLIACLVWPTFPALAQNPLQNSAVRKLQIAVRLDDAPEHQRIRTMDGARARILTGASRTTSERRYVQTPMGVVPQEVTVVQDQAAGFDVIPRLVGERVQVEIAHRSGSSSANGKLGEWFDLGAVATAEGTRKMRIRIDEIP
jgi:hypothetical protein